MNTATRPVRVIQERVKPSCCIPECVDKGIWYIWWNDREHPYESDTVSCNVHIGDLLPEGFTQFNIELFADRFPMLVRGEGA